MTGGLYVHAHGDEIQKLETPIPSSGERKMSLGSKKILTIPLHEHVVARVCLYGHPCASKYVCGGGHPCASM